MMDDALEKMLKGKNGEALRALSESEEARRLGASLPEGAAEAAVRSGDAEAMRAVLQKLLSTDEGRALAEKITKLGGK